MKLHTVFNVLFDILHKDYDVRIIDFGDRVLEDTNNNPIYIIMHSYMFVDDVDSIIVNIYKTIEREIINLREEEYVEFDSSDSKPKIIFKNLREKDGAISFKMGICLN